MIFDNDRPRLVSRKTRENDLKSRPCLSDEGASEFGRFSHSKANFKTFYYLIFHSLSYILK